MIHGGSILSHLDVSIVRSVRQKKDCTVCIRRRILQTNIVDTIRTGVTFGIVSVTRRYSRAMRARSVSQESTKMCPDRQVATPVQQICIQTSSEPPATTRADRVRRIQTRRRQAAFRVTVYAMLDIRRRMSILSGMWMYTLSVSFRAARVWPGNTRASRGTAGVSNVPHTRTPLPSERPVWTPAPHVLQTRALQRAVRRASATPGTQVWGARAGHVRPGRTRNLTGIQSVFYVATGSIPQRLQPKPRVRVLAAPQTPTLLRGAAR